MEKIYFKFLISDTRARVYLLWAAIVATGYTCTHFYQNANINFVWTTLSAIGFYYMYRVMPLGVRQMKLIFAAWLVPITAGIFISVVSAQGLAFEGLLAYLGAFWLAVTAVGFAWNGLVDPPSKWYLISSGLCLAGAVLIYQNIAFLIPQYLVAGIISTWAMLNLFIFRTD